MFGTAQMKNAKPNGPVKSTPKGFMRSYLVPGREGFSLVKVFSKTADSLKDNVDDMVVRFKDTDFVFVQD